jgi:SAM-dependent methyltransferase
MGVRLAILRRPMRWIAKALVQDVLSVLPRGDALNYRLQRHVTHSLPVSDAMLRMHAKEAAGHLQAVRKHGAVEPRDAVLYEFGAGWDLVGPIVLATLGVTRQVVVDIRANARLDLVNDTLRRVGRLAPELGSARDVSSRELATIGELEDRFGIRYAAPCDARRTDLPSNSIDAITSTFTLEHIPEPDIAAILEECARILKPAGVVSFAIDMKDHYSYFDPRLSPYHFLSIPDRRWRLVNPPLHYQNRLRLSDYRRLVTDAGLTIVEEHVRRPTDRQRAQLRTTDVVPRFRSRSPEDLLALELRIAARNDGR